MKNIKLFFLIILFISMNIELISYDKITKINLLYTDLYLFINTRLDINFFLKEKYLKNNMIIKEIILEDSILNAIQKFIDNNLKQTNIAKCNDLRVVLQIYRKSGKVEFLSFGKSFVLNYKKKFYKQNIQLLKFIVPFMKEEYREDYYFYINELEKYFQTK